MRALSVELRPGHVNAAGCIDMDRLVVRKLAVSALRLAVSVPGRDRCQSGRLPGDAIPRHSPAVEQQLDLVWRREVERLADEVRRLAVRAERNDGIASCVV